jgi:hypothetical protein
MTLRALPEALKRHPRALSLLLWQVMSIVNRMMLMALPEALQRLL